MNWKRASTVTGLAALAIAGYWFIIYQKTGQVPSVTHWRRFDLHYPVSRWWDVSLAPIIGAFAGLLSLEGRNWITQRVFTLGKTAGAVATGASFLLGSVYDLFLFAKEYNLSSFIWRVVITALLSFGWMGRATGYRAYVPCVLFVMVFYALYEGVIIGAIAGCIEMCFIFMLPFTLGMSIKAAQKKIHTCGIISRSGHENTGAFILICDQALLHSKHDHQRSTT